MPEAEVGDGAVEVSVRTPVRPTDVMISATSEGYRYTVPLGSH